MITGQHMSVTSATVASNTVYTSCKAFGFASRRRRLGRDTNSLESESQGVAESPSTVPALQRRSVNFGTVKCWHIFSDPESSHDGTVLAVEEKRVQDRFFKQVLNHPRDIP